MRSTDAELVCRVTDRDFLLGSVWEGTGDELHTNRHVARREIFGARILSGISGMLLTVATYRRALIWEPPPTSLEWSFAAPLFEGSELAVSGAEADGAHRIVGRVDGEEVTGGSVLAGAPVPTPLVEGTHTRGRTITAADLDLFRDWLGPGSADHDLVPWPLLVLITSGLVNRTSYLGDPKMVLNRWFRWSFAAPPEVEDTVHGVIGEVRTRPSERRPELNVAEFAVGLVSSPTGRQLARVEWVGIFR